jgi:adenine-specific DNA-methyltransferase
MSKENSVKKIQPGDPESMSQDIVAQNIEQLQDLFPEAWTEGKVDFEILMQLLGGAFDEKEEKYGLNWHGKRNARRLALMPSVGTLRPCPEESKDWDITRNLVIEGDNLEVLKLLQKGYAGSVQMIYIDPPYNTGKDFVYPDDYRDTINNYKQLTGQSDSEGRVLSSNSEANGRFHTNWLNMIYPRLMLARLLLKESGVIFVSIDDSEQAQLRQVMDEIFGEENFVEQFIWKKSYGGGAKERYAVTQHEYCLLYARSINSIDSLWLAPDPEVEKKYYDFSDEHVETRGPYRVKPLEATKSMGRRENLVYPIKAPDGTEVWPKRQWWWSRERAERVQAENGLVFNKRPDGWTVSYKQYLIGEDGEKRGQKPFSIIDGIYTQRGTAIIRKLFDDEVVFQFPKPVELISRFIEIGTDRDSIILDFFAGSGTAGHAVMEQNVRDGGNRRFILVQLPEPIDRNDNEQKAAALFCEKIRRPCNIAELTKERLRRAAELIAKESPVLAADFGFRVFKLDSSCVSIWAPDPHALKNSLLDSVEHIRADRSDSDILFELLLTFGIDLCTPVDSQVLGGKRVFGIGAGSLIVCLEPKVASNEAESLALGIVDYRKHQNPSGESTVILRDSAFVDDVTKTNFSAILQQHGFSVIKSL